MNKQCQLCKSFSVKGDTTKYGYCDSNEHPTDPFWTCDKFEKISELKYNIETKDGFTTKNYML